MATLPDTACGGRGDLVLAWPSQTTILRPRCGVAEAQTPGQRLWRPDRPGHWVRRSYSEEPGLPAAASATPILGPLHQSCLSSPAAAAGGHPTSPTETSAASIQALHEERLGWVYQI